ncbi:hypothetical protein HGA02_08990, partial [Cellulomonas septica]|nr:hypothetical protein [Cellulomonas septica]
HTLGLDDLRRHLADLDEQEVLTATGLTVAEMDERRDGTDHELARPRDDPADDVDRAIRATRAAVFPCWGLDPDLD